MRILTAVGALVMCVLVTSCGLAEPVAAPSGSNGTLRVLLTASPFADGKALVITFSEMDVHLSTTADGTWTRLPFADGATSRACDLNKLTTTEDILGTGPLPPGHYTQVRLVVSSAVIYFDNEPTGSACATTIAAPSGGSAIVTIPSGEAKTNSEFDISSAITTTMVLAFGGTQSLQQTSNGQFMMTPVMTVLSVG
jgi:hypothetical protein